MKLTAVVAAALAAAAGAGAAPAASGAMFEVGTYAQWPTYPHSLVMETAEFLAEEDPTLALYWAYVEALGGDAAAATAAATGDVAASTRLAFQTARGLVPPLVYDVLRLSVLLRAHSPAVEAVRQVATKESFGYAACADAATGSPAPAWADVFLPSAGGDASSAEGAQPGYAVVPVCNADGLAATLASRNASARVATVPHARLYGWDRTRTSSGDEGLPIAVVYGAIGSADFNAFHAAAAAAVPGATYVHRHFPGASPAAEAATWVAGYGIGVDLKSTEYKFMDDRKTGAKAGGEGSGDAPAGASSDAAPAPTSADPTLDASVLQATRRLNGFLQGLLAPEDGGAASLPHHSGVDWDALAAARPATHGAEGSKARAFAKAKKAVEKAAAGGGFSYNRTAGGLMTAFEGNPGPVLAALAGAEGSDAAAMASGWLWEGSTGVQMKPWEVADLGLQTAAFVLDAAARASAQAAAGNLTAYTFDNDPLQRLVSVSSNFPSYARFLSLLPVPPQLRSEVEVNAGFLRAGSAHMAVNGISVDPTAANPQFNLFSLLNVLRSEADVVSQFDALPLSAADRRRVQALAIAESPESKEAAKLAAAAAAEEEAAAGGEEGEAAAGESSDAKKKAAAKKAPKEDAAGAAADGKAVIRVDLLPPPAAELPLLRAADADAAAAAADAALAGVAGRHPLITWFNDLEVDDMYKRFQTSFMVLLQPSWQLPALRRNTFNAALFLDGGAPSTMKTLSQIAYFLQMGVPVRFGVLLDPGASEELGGAGARPTAWESDDAALDAPASGLDVALLHAGLIRKHDATVGRKYLLTLGGHWQQLTEAARAAGSIGPAEDLPVTLRLAVDAFISVANAESQAWTSTAATGAAAEALADADGSLRAALAGVAAWQAGRGVPTPSLVLNGRIKTASAEAGIDLQQDLMPLVGEELQLLQRLLMAGQLDDTVEPSLLAALLGKATKTSRATRTPKGAKKTTKAERSASEAAWKKLGIDPAVLLPPIGALSLPGAGAVVARFAPAIYTPPEEQAFLPLTAPEAAPALASAAYLHAPGTADAIKPVSLSVFEDLSSPAGLRAAAAALSFIGWERGAAAPVPAGVTPAAARELVRAARVGLVHTGGAADVAGARTLGEAVAAAAALIGDKLADASGASVNVPADLRALTLARVVDAALDVAVATAAEGAALVALPGRLSARLAEVPGLKPAVATRLVDAVSALVGAHDDAATTAWGAQTATQLERAAATARRLLAGALRPGTSGAGLRAVAVNGRVVEVADATAAAAALLPVLTPLPGAGVAPADLAALVAHEKTARARAIAAVVRSLSFPPELVDPDAVTADFVSGVVQAAASAVGAALKVAPGNAGGRAAGRTALQTQVLSADYTSFVTAPLSSAAGAGSVGISVVAILDPASEDAQRVAPLLLLLRDRLGATVTVHLNPVARPAPSELPVKSYYRFVVPADVTDAALGAEAGTPAAAPLAAWRRPAAVFGWLPQQAVLTLRPHVPEPWNVQTAEADADLDNLRLVDAAPAVVAAWRHAASASGSSSSGGVPPLSVSYLIRDLVVAGQCLDLTSAAFPNGLQLQLLARPPAAPAAAAGVPPGPWSVVSDTLVMQNLGYWQLKGAPGMWSLRLAPGRASSLYSIVLPTAASGNASATTASAGAAAPWLGWDTSQVAFGTMVRHRRKAGAAGTTSPAAAARGEEAWGWGGEVAVPLLDVAVRDFTGPVAQLAVRKRPGKEGVALLDSMGSGGAAGGASAAAEADDAGSADSAGRLWDPYLPAPAAAASEAGADTAAVEVDASGGIFASLGRLLGGAAGSPSAATVPAPSNASAAAVAVASSASLTHISPASARADPRPLIHVFSLASGHLYERFLKIMMLSAVKRTERSRIKFWLVENFLSPQFKSTIPALAEAYGFEVGLVAYKWPNWLRQQTEKQRIIWGYKILFLDVLFPLSVPKVIYVDSDQVVRADLTELWEHDLQGAPYAYTPFCDSREETLGFQFWRQGYWKDHLRGKPYHISALYVVDLAAFRKYAVGDTLRSVYDSLSRDPGSLANLDQDLPNYAQGMVPIQSLPQEWLWCESWCSDATKQAAKTIDLCNNPRFKEPKLNMARRVINNGEGAPKLFNETWEELDAEVAAAEAAWAASSASAASASAVA